MARRVFTKCLNQELKIFNFSVGSLIGGGILLVLAGLSKGLMWGMGAESRAVRDGVTMTRSATADPCRQAPRAAAA